MSDPVVDFLSRYPPEIQDICQALRKIVLAAMPEIKEVVYDSQNHLGYSLSGRMREMIIYLVPMKDYVRLGFMWGGELPDPQRLLQGEGKRLRHVKVRSLGEATLTGIRDLVSAARVDAVQMKRGK